MMNTPGFFLSIIFLAFALATFGQDTTHKRKPIITTATKPGFNPAGKPAYPGTRRYGYKRFGTGYKRDSALKAVYHKPGTYLTPADTNKPATQLPVPAVVDNTLSGQYNSAYKKMYSYERTVFESFYRNFMDTLRLERRKTKELTNKADLQAKTITALQTDASAKAQSLSDSMAKINQVSFLGMPMSKTLFGIIMWSLVLVLGVSLAVVIYMSGAARREAAYRTQLHDELSAEFQSYKTKANDKEKKLARDLQTERNKVDELTGKK